VLQHDAVCCNVLQDTVAVSCLSSVFCKAAQCVSACSNVLQRGCCIKKFGCAQACMRVRTCVTATRCNTLYHTVAHCSTRQHAASRSKTLQHAQTHTDILQHAASHCKTRNDAATRCDPLQHTVTQNNTPDLCTLKGAARETMRANMI